jgi:hypothetical protein
MGSLITETPYSEITATLEILDHLGVGRDDLKKFRAANEEVQSQVAHILKNATSCARISVTSQDAAISEPLLSAIATTAIGATGAKQTKKCFRGSRWAYRDGDLDNWLPADQPDAPACTATTFALLREWTFAEAAEKIVGLKIPGASAKLLGHELIRLGHTMTLAQAEEMAEATERGQKTGMRTDGWDNFFFVETGDEEDPVSVLNVLRSDRGWLAGVLRLGHGYRWIAESRLLLRNSVAPTL